MSQSADPISPSRPAGPFLTSAIEFLRARRPADAIEPLRQAAALEPDNPMIQHDLGLACLEAGLVRDGIAYLQRAVSLNPSYTDAYFRLGMALEKIDDLNAAILAFDRATEIQPSLAEAWFRTGALCYTLGLVEAAAERFRRAATTAAKTSYGRLGEARALLIEDRNPEAEKVLREALAADSQNAMAYELLGNLLSDLGRFSEARACFERAVAIAPMLAGAYYELVRCRPITSDDRDLLPAMQSAVDMPGLERGQQHRLHLAIGKAAEDLGKYQLAMNNFDAADALRRSFGHFNSETFATGIDRMIARFTPEVIARAQQLGNPDATPVLVVGMPRSGTTLVEQILSMHPEIGACGELNFWNERGAQWLGLVAEDEGSTTSSDFLAKAAVDYLGVLRGIEPEPPRVSDKMPFNFLWAGLIHLAFPNATIIHCRRAAIDVAISIHQTHFHPRLAFPTGGAELVEYFRCYERLIKHWKKVLPPARFVEVEYEELTTAPEPVIRKMIAACGLAWDDACLRPESNRRAVKTPSKWQTRQPIYRSSVARWKRYEPFLGPLQALLDRSIEGTTNTGS